MRPTIAIVTGTSAGIGRATAARFAQQGLQVFGIARRPSGIAGVRDLCADLSDSAEVAQVIRDLSAQLGEPAPLCLVNNAGIMLSDSVGRFDAAASEHTLRLNVLAPAHLTAGLLPLMAPGSSVVFVGSTLSEIGVPGRLSYVASKHAVVGLMRATVQDLFGSGIHTACLCPGFTRTEGMDPALAAFPGLNNFVAEKTSFHRWIEPEEIAELIDFIARTPSLNGAVLHANLGQRAS